MPDPFYHSAEVRWFLPHQGQWDTLLTWFTRQGQLNIVEETTPYIRQPDAPPFVKQERPRTDVYLPLPNCEAVGVKQRQGRLEVKALVVEPRPFAAGEAAGRVDEWVKWSLKPSEGIASTLESDLRQAGVWQKVEKRRWLQKYAFTTGSLSAVSPDAWPDAGCNVELTLLDVEGSVNAWVTFGFEAFGTPNCLSLLHEMVWDFFALHGSAPLALVENDSLSYPAWLVRLV
jgi:hypothetical protein